MNIFILDENPELCAQYHCDKHVVKMILEHVQLLSTAYRLCASDIPPDSPAYRVTHQNHPSAKWVRESQANYEYLCWLTKHLNDEYKFRYGHKNNHKSFDVLLQLPACDYLPDVGLTPFAQAMPDQYKHTDAVTAYRNYYIGGKSDIISYTRRPYPEWLAIDNAA